MLIIEPKIKVALLQNYKEASLKLEGQFSLSCGRSVSGHLTASARQGEVVLCDSTASVIAKQKEIVLVAHNTAFFTVSDVKIGIDFHWQRRQEQSFRGDLILSVATSGFNLINEILLEDYLKSVISSEMSATAPLEFLKAQAVCARSWLVAMLERKKFPKPPHDEAKNSDSEIIMWKDVNDHEGFDVCADDHCQRYQGITNIVLDNVNTAIKDTSGQFLVYAQEVCDARYYKCCGGRTEEFPAAWEDKSVPYLFSVADDEGIGSTIVSEEDAQAWLSQRPPAYCNTGDKALLSRILPSFDQETVDFYRWQTVYTRNELEDIIRKKSGIDFGTLQNITATERGPSGRIYKLKIEGSKRTVVVGKELEIRRWLSESHLLSSAFFVRVERDKDGTILRFIFNGGGWGHGVGLCQIGAAVMAAKGFKAEQILAHYFSGANIDKLY